MDSPEGIGAGEAGGRGWHGHPVHPSHLRWPGTPTAVLEGGAHKRSAVGRIAPKGRTSRGPLPAGDRPTCESVPFRPDALRQRPAVTCGRTKRGDIVRRQGRQDMAEPAGERKRPISFGGRGRRVLCATWGAFTPGGREPPVCTPRGLRAAGVVNFEKCNRVA